MVGYFKNFDKKTTNRIIKLLAKKINNPKSTIYIFGNGGSLAIATHWVSDFNKTVFSHNLEGHTRRFQAIRLPSTEEERYSRASSERVKLFCLAFVLRIAILDS